MKKELLIFNDNKIFINWNKYVKSTDLVEYILPTQDLEDLNLIKDKPYTEMPDSASRPDSLLASMWWQLSLQRELLVQIRIKQA